MWSYCPGYLLQLYKPGNERGRREVNLRFFYE
jgi:hypothetical protein